MSIFCQLLVGCAVFQLISAQCLQCSSRDNSQNCVDPDGTILSRSCPGNPLPIECFSRVVNGETIRGCANQLEAEVRAQCTNSTETNGCHVCSRPNCNVGLFPIHRLKCHFCDGSSEENCTEAITASPSKACPIYMEDDRCITRKSGDQVIRQCLSNYEDCRKEKGCIICDSYGCNNQEYNAAIPTSIHNTVLFTGLAYFLSKL